MRSYARDAGLVLAANAVNALSALGVQACLAWFLMPEGRGQYGSCLLFATLLTLTFSVGQEMANVYFVGSGRQNLSEACSQSLVIAVVGTAVACGLGYALTRTSLSFLNRASLTEYRTALLCIPTVMVHMYLTHLFLGVSAVVTYNALNVLPGVLGLAGLMVAWWAGRLSVGTALVIHAVSLGVVGLAALVILVVRNGVRPRSPTVRSMKESLAYGARFYVGKLSSMTNVQIGNLVLMFSTVSPEELGLFMAATALASRVWMLPDSMQTALLPRTTADPLGRREATAQCVRVCLVCTAVVLLVLALVARPLIAVLLSARFLPIHGSLLILLPGVLFRVMPKILSAYFNGIGRPGITSLGIGASVVVNLGLVMMMLPVWGLAGAALAMSSAYLLEAGLMVAAFRWVSGLPVSALLWPTREDWSVLRRIAGAWNRRSVRTGGAG